MWKLKTPLDVSVVVTYRKKPNPVVWDNMGQQWPIGRWPWYLDRVQPARWPVKSARVPSGIGSKTAEIRQKSAIFAPPPTPWLTLARAMFLANIYVKNDMGC
jgi:hypothetical protein